ncbi:PRKR-interacting protein 1 [Chamberlinius hualienensis]
MATELGTKKKKVYVPKPLQIIRNATDMQRIKLGKLMEHPERPVIIPEPPKEKSLPPPPEFNRNVMGSSAGAGSGEFHVYRHLRRREYARQKQIAESADKDDKDVEYHRKIEENKRLAEERTAKKRNKRLKKKERAKQKKLKTDNKDETDDNKTESQCNRDESDSDSDEQKEEEIAK